MPSIKRSVKAEEVKTGFEAYDGLEPSKRGMYRAAIKQFNYKKFKTGATGFAILLELEAAHGDPHNHAQFDGYPIWTNIIFGEHESMIARESNLYAALGAADEPMIMTEKGEESSGVKVRTVGGKNPIGSIVNADIKMGKYEGTDRPEVDGIYKIHDAKVGKGKAKAIAAPEPDVEEPDVEDGEEMDAREEELNGLKLADLREIADELGLDTKGLKKADIVASILDEEFGTEFAEEEEPDEEEEEDDEDDEAEDDEDDEAEERRAELAELSRIDLKKILKGADPSAKVLKSLTDDDLVELIMAEEFESDEPPF